jgi:hypothetical protein
MRLMFVVDPKRPGGYVCRLPRLLARVLCDWNDGWYGVSRLSEVPRR